MFKHQIIFLNDSDLIFVSLAAIWQATVCFGSEVRKNVDE